MKKFILMFICSILAGSLFAKDVWFSIQTLDKNNKSDINKIEIVNATRLENIKGCIKNDSNFGIGFKLKDTGDKNTLSVGDMQKKWTQTCDFILFDVNENIKLDIRCHLDGNDLYIAIVEDFNKN